MDIAVLTRCPLTSFHPLCGTLRTGIVNFYCKYLVVFFLGRGTLKCLKVKVEA